uniref:Potassium/proton antiporter CemA n=1 Tax=Lambia antarctica TaxID=101717 RepID=A0A1L2EDM2_9CHLO|nr:chloroplast envelope membrane protein [Lambia antarctica]ANN39002.1 chloroplast envelope membrane protein [Lambia antarctica]
MDEGKPRAFEKIGLIPRSIIRTFNRFLKQLLDNTNRTVLYEFRISRYQTIASIKCFINLIFFPYMFHFLVQKTVIYPFCEYQWNKTAIIVNINQMEQEKIFFQLKNFDEQFFFEQLLVYKENPTKKIKFNYNKKQLQSKLNLDKKKSYQEFLIQLAEKRNKDWLFLISNILSDCLTFFVFFKLLFLSTPQLIILKSFLIESIYSLNDTTKSFFLILGTDLLVGFHSSKGWELWMENFLNHFGFSADKDFIFLFVSTFPVILDTVFKYWIFRYLNKISPSTVATYQNMLE